MERRIERARKAVTQGKGLESQSDHLVTHDKKESAWASPPSACSEFTFFLIF